MCKYVFYSKDQIIIVISFEPDKKYLESGHTLTHVTES
jgi:hypothetical protein